MTIYKTSNVAGLGPAIALLRDHRGHALLDLGTNGASLHRPALEQAQKLLVFHVGPDDRIEIDNP